MSSVFWYCNTQIDTFIYF